MLGRGRKFAKKVFCYKAEKIQEDAAIGFEGEIEKKPGEAEEETNPFLKSITRNLKTPKPESDSPESQSPWHSRGQTPEVVTERANILGFEKYLGSEKNREHEGISESEISGSEGIPESQTTLELLSSLELQNSLELQSSLELQNTLELQIIPAIEKILELEPYTDSETTLKLPPIKAFIPSPMSEILARICDYFVEFAFDNNYSQFKFLGPFTDEEIYAINEFLDDAMRYLNGEGKCHLAHVFDIMDFEINEDASRNTV